MDSLSEVQKDAAMERMRKYYVDHPPIEADFCDRTTLTRFLVARQYRVEPAIEMLNGCLAWRQKMDVKNVLKREPELRELIASGRAYMHLTDRQNRPCMVVHAAKHKKEPDLELVTVYVVWCLETALTYLPPGQSQITAIIDFKDSGLKNFEVNLIRRIFVILEKSYPERIAKIYMLNPPWVFLSIWKMLKGLLDKRTADKIVFLGSDGDRVLGDAFAPENLQTPFGGRSDYVYRYTPGEPWGLPPPMAPQVLAYTAGTVSTLPPAEAPPPAYHEIDDEKLAPSHDPLGSRGVPRPLSTEVKAREERRASRGGDAREERRSSRDAPGADRRPGSGRRSTQRSSEGSEHRSGEGRVKQLRDEGRPERHHRSRHRPEGGSSRAEDRFLERTGSKVSRDDGRRSSREADGVGASKDERRLERAGSRTAASRDEGRRSSREAAAGDATAAARGDRSSRRSERSAASALRDEERPRSEASDRRHHRHRERSLLGATADHVTKDTRDERDRKDRSHRQPGERHRRDVDRLSATQPLPLGAARKEPKTVEASPLSAARAVSRAEAQSRKDRARAKKVQKSTSWTSSGDGADSSTEFFSAEDGL